MTESSRAARDFRHTNERKTMLVFSQTRAGQHCTEAQIRAVARKLLMRWTSGINRDRKRAQLLLPAVAS